MKNICSLATDPRISLADIEYIYTRDNDRSNAIVADSYYEYCMSAINVFNFPLFAQIGIAQIIRGNYTDARKMRLNYLRMEEKILATRLGNIFEECFSYTSNITNLDLLTNFAIDENLPRHESMLMNAAYKILDMRGITILDSEANSLYKLMFKNCRVTKCRFQKPFSSPVITSLPFIVRTNIFKQLNYLVDIISRKFGELEKIRSIIEQKNHYNNLQYEDEDADFKQKNHKEEGNDDDVPNLVDNIDNINNTGDNDENKFKNQNICEQFNAIKDIDLRISTFRNVGKQNGLYMVEYTLEDNEDYDTLLSMMDPHKVFDKKEEFHEFLHDLAAKYEIIESMNEDDRDEILADFYSDWLGSIAV
jgi:hypothetical protein